MKTTRNSLPRALSLGCCLLGVTTVFAYPPTPPAVITGKVRGEYGFLPETKGLSLILLSDGEEVARTTVSSSGAFRSNYKMALPLDMNPATGSYRTVALKPKDIANHSFVAEQNGRRMPVTAVEAAKTEEIGESGSRLVYNFQIGEDTDGDSLPDSWERFQASLIGSGDEDPLSLFSKKGDQDGDGMTDYEEYLAGTFAGFFAEAFNVRLVKVYDDGAADISFLAVDGKSYRIQGTADFKTWHDLEIGKLDDPSEGSLIFKATNTNTQVVQTEPIAELDGKKTFYRLIVD